MKKKIVFVGALLVVQTSIFAQQEKETQIKEVTLASKTLQSQYKTGKNVQLLSEKDLEKYKGQNLNEVLQQVAGIQITGNYNNNPEPKSSKIRGGKLANILILIDGIPMKDVTGNDYTAMDLRLLALENIESIEILNGASSVLYGSNATISVINITTKKSKHKKIEGTVSARGGSFATFAQNLGVQGKLNELTYRFSGFNEKSDGFSSADGVNFDKDGYEKQNLNAGIGFQNSDFILELNGGFNHHFYDFDQGAFTDGKYRGNDGQYFGGINTKFNYNKGFLSFNTRFSGNNRLVQNDDLGTGYADQYSYKGKNAFAELFTHYQVTDYLNFTVGLQYEAQKMGSQSVPYGETKLKDVLKIEDTNQQNFDVFANVNGVYKEFNLQTGIRNTKHSKFGNHLVYSINPYYLQEFSEYYFKAGYSFATAFIAPTLYQNYGSLPWLLPNFDLKPETNESHEMDVSFGKKDRSLVINTSFFLRNEKETFAYKTNADYTGSFINLGENKVKGLELGFDYSLSKNFRLGGNFSFVEKQKSETMLRQPKQRVNSYLELLPNKTTKITFSYQFVAKRTDAYYDMIRYSVVNVDLQPFHLFNLNLNQKIIKNLEAFANIGNLFNTSYIDVVGFTSKPRNYTVGFGYQF